MIGEAQGKEAGQIAVVGAAAGLHVGDPPNVVLFLQVHVHDIGLVAQFLVQALAQHARLFIYLHVFHHVGRQVVEHDLAILGKEVLAVEQQALYILAVDIDAAVVLELHTRHLADEAVEHAALRELKGIGIKHQRVALVVELDLGGLHHHIVQLDRLGLAFQEHILYIAHSLAAAAVHLLGRQGDHRRLIALGLNMQQHLGHVASLGSDPVHGRQVAARLVLAGAAAVDGHAVAGEQCDLSPIDEHVGEVVFHLPYHHARLVFVFSYRFGCRALWPHGQHDDHQCENNNPSVHVLLVLKSIYFFCKYK